MLSQEKIKKNSQRGRKTVSGSNSNSYCMNLYTIGIEIQRGTS